MKEKVIKKIMEAIAKFRKEHKLPPNSRGRLDKGFEYVILNPTTNPKIVVWDSHSFWDGSGDEPPISIPPVRLLPTKKQLIKA
ncbi:MAG: hypothetical protein ACOC1X_00370 [Promethearchaeota archaeon]